MTVRPRPSGVPDHTLPVKVNLSLLLPALLLTALALTGCGLFRANAQLGPDLQPHLGAGVSIPLGK